MWRPARPCILCDVAAVCLWGFPALSFGPPSLFSTSLFFVSHLSCSLNPTRFSFVSHFSFSLDSHFGQALDSL